LIYQSLKRKINIVRKKKINHNHVARVRKAYKKREKKRSREHTPFDKLVSDFISMVSHELRTPLAIVKEGLSLVNDGDLGSVTPEQQKALTLSLNSVNRLIKLVSQLLDISRLEKGKLKLDKTIFNLLDLTEEGFKGFEKLAEKQGKTFSYQETTDREKLMIYGDPDKFSQVLVNIMHNALKYTKSGGAISINVTDKNEKLYISIRDQGPGIPKEELPLIFNQFHQVRRRNEMGSTGLGLGLSIADQIVVLHGGQIAVRSKLGKGSEFVVKLPLAIPFLAQIIKIIRRERLERKEIKDLREYGLMKLLLQTMEYSGLDIDEREQLLHALSELELHKGTLPSIWDHIEDFKRIDLKDNQGRDLSAKDYKEAFLMAYIEKNMGDFKYQGKHIYEYGDTNAKRRALMALVKELSTDLLEATLKEIENV